MDAASITLRSVTDQDVTPDWLSGLIEKDAPSSSWPGLRQSGPGAGVQAVVGAHAGEFGAVASQCRDDGTAVDG